MSYVHPYSKRCEKSEVDLFSVPPTQLSLEKGRWIDYRPLSSVENPDSAITFLIAGTDEYVDLSKTILYVEGTKTITYVESDTHAGSTAAVPKTVSIPVPGTGNQGFAKRHEYIKGSKTFVLTRPIFSDVFMSDRLLLNMLDFKVVLNRSSNAFCLMDTNVGNAKINPKVKLTDVVLKIRKVKVDQTVSDATELILKQTPALYPIRRVECKALTIPQNLPGVRQDNIFSGIIPKSFVFGLVDANSYSGENNKNPYNFQHFKVKTVTLSVNGEEIPFKQLVLDYTSATAKDFIQAYNTLFPGTGKVYANTGLDITREEYAGGYTLYAFDLTPDMCNTADYFNTVQRGSLSVDITFDGQTTVPINMVCYGDFENIIRIDSERNVVYDMS